MRQGCGSGPQSAQRGPGVSSEGAGGSPPGTAAAGSLGRSRGVERVGAGGSADEWSGEVLPGSGFSDLPEGEE